MPWTTRRQPVAVGRHLARRARCVAPRRLVAAAPRGSGGGAGLRF